MTDNSSNSNTTKSFSQEFSEWLDKHDPFPATGGHSASATNQPAEHLKVLSDIEAKLSATWIEKNLSSSDQHVSALVKRVFRSAFHAGAAANQSLNDRKK